MRDNKSYLILIVFLALISFMCLSLSTSFAYMSRVRTSGNTQSITTGNFTSYVEYKPVDNLLFSTMSDTDGLSQKDFASISITKDNNYSVFYTLGLHYDDNVVKEENKKINLLPMEFVKVALFEIKDGVVNDDPLLGPINVTDLPLLSASNDEPYNDIYMLSFGTFLVTDKTKTFAIKAWIDENIKGEFDDAILSLGVDITQEALISKSIFNISGKVIDENNNIINKARVSIHGGLISSLIDNNYFMLRNVVEGTYGLTVSYNNEKYNTTIHLQNDSVENSVLGLTSNKGKINNQAYIQSSAFINYSTVGNILRSNNFDNHTNIIHSEEYNIPTSFIITGKDVLGVDIINNIIIKLNEDKTISLEVENEEK